MTKAEYIERYGLERYEQHKAQMKQRMSQRYQNDSEYRESHNARMKQYKKQRYQNDSEFRESYKVRMKRYTKQRYQNDQAFRESEKARKKAYSKARYQNDPAFRESMKAYKKAQYVKDSRIDLVENYEFAVKDNFKGWDIHHRLELHPDCSVRFAQRSLIKLDLYYDRPPSELVWLRRSEHRRMHGKSRAKN